MCTSLPVSGFEDFFYFPDDHDLALNKKGEILNTKTKKILKPQKNIKGYYQVVISKIGGKAKSYRLNRMMARTFLSKPQHLKHLPFTDLHVNHIDSDRGNDDLNNLEWCTASENVIHGHELGKINTRMCVLCKNIETGEIKKYLGITSLAKNIGVSLSTLYKHLNSKKAGTLQAKGLVFKFDNGLAWPKLPEKPLILGNSKPKITTLLIKCKKTHIQYVVEGYKYASELMGCSVETLHRNMKKYGIFEKNGFIVGPI